MNRRLLYPVLLALAGLALLAAATFVILPQVIVSRLAPIVLRDWGLALSADGGASLSMTEGLEVLVQDVVLASDSDQSVPLMQAATVRIPVSLAGMFSPGTLPGKLVVEDAVFSVGALRLPDGNADDPTSPPVTIDLRNAALKIKWNGDARFTASDIDGRVVRDGQGALLADLRGLVNGVSTQLTATFDDVQRLVRSGSPSDLALTAGEHSITFSGRARLPDLALDGTVDLQSADAGGFVAWLGGNGSLFAAATGLSAQGPLSAVGPNFTLPDLTLALGQAQGTGALRLDLSAERPQLDADLTFDRMTLPGPAATDAPLSRPWSESPWDLSLLSALNSRFALKAKTAAFGRLLLEAATVSGDIKDGVLALRSDGTVNGQAVAAQLSLAKGEGAARLDLKLTAAEVDAAALLGPLLGLPHMSGAMTLALDVQANGLNTASFLSSLGGTAEINLAQGTVSGTQPLAQLAQSATTSAQGWGAGGGPALALENLQLNSKIADGIATVSSADGTLAGVTIGLTGTIDILRQTLDLVVAAGPKTAEAKALKLPARSVLRGQWNTPAFGPAADAANASP